MKRKSVILVNLVLALFLVLSSVCYAFGNVPVKSIKLNKTKITLTVGKSEALKATVSPTNATKKVLTWSSSNKNVATVSKTGLVAAVKAGNTIISAKSGDGKVTAKCSVIVIKAPDPVKVSWYWNEGNVQLPDDSYISKKILKDLNIKYIHISPKGTDYEERLQLLLASQDIPDVITSYNTLTANLVKWGVVQPIGKYLNDKYIPNVIRISNNWDTAIKYLTRKDGKIYSIPNCNKDSVNEITYIRYDWLKNLGLEVPKTYDELRDVLTKFTKNDPDKNGKDDTVGTMSNEFYGTYAISLNFAANPDSWYKDSDGNATLGMFLPRQKDFLKYIKSLIDSGAMSSELATTKFDNINEKIKAGKVGFLFSYNSWDFNTDIKKVQPSADWRPMTPPKGMYDKGYIPSATLMREEYCISSQCKNLDAVLKLMNYFADDTSTATKQDFTGNYWPMKYGEPNVHWKIMPEGRIETGVNDSTIKERRNADPWAGRTRRFISKFDITWKTSKTPEQLKILNEELSYPRMLDIPDSDTKKRIETDSIVIPDNVSQFTQEWYLIKWSEFFYRAVLGKVDIDKGWDEFVAEAQKAELKKINESMTKIFKDAGLIK